MRERLEFSERLKREVRPPWIGYAIIYTVSLSVLAVLLWSVILALGKWAP